MQAPRGKAFPLTETERLNSSFPNGKGSLAREASTSFTLRSRPIPALGESSAPCSQPRGRLSVGKYSKGRFFPRFRIITGSTECGRGSCGDCDRDTGKKGQNPRGPGAPRPVSNSSTHHPFPFFGLNLPGGSYGPGQGARKWDGSGRVPLRFLATLPGRVRNPVAAAASATASVTGGSRLHRWLREL